MHDGDAVLVRGLGRSSARAVAAPVPGLLARRAEDLPAGDVEHDLAAEIGAKHRRPSCTDRWRRRAPPAIGEATLKPGPPPGAGSMLRRARCCLSRTACAFRGAARRRCSRDRHGARRRRSRCRHSRSPQGAARLLQRIGRHPDRKARIDPGVEGEFHGHPPSQSFAPTGRLRRYCSRSDAARHSRRRARSGRLSKRGSFFKVEEQIFARPPADHRHQPVDILDPLDRRPASARYFAQPMASLPLKTGETPTRRSPTSTSDRPERSVMFLIAARR